MLRIYHRWRKSNEVLQPGQAGLLSAYFDNRLGKLNASFTGA